MCSKIEGSSRRISKEALFQYLICDKMLSIDLYAQTPADERKKSNPRQKLRQNPGEWSDFRSFLTDELLATERYEMSQTPNEWWH
jgi:hypothetical protein